MNRYQKVQSENQTSAAENNKRHYDQPIGWFLVVSSLFIVVTTLKRRHSWHVFLPQLVPYTGILFVIISMIVLILFCLWQKSYVNLFLVLAIFAGGFMFGYMTESIAGEPKHLPNKRFEKFLNQRGVFRTNYDWTRHRLIFGLGLSSLVLGGKLLKENSSL